MGAFILASVLCAAAPNLPLLTAGRALQAIGAAMLMPKSLAILGAAFKDEDRGRAVSIWAAVGAADGAAGPLLGGWLIDVVGWRSIFLINLPIGAASIALAARYLDNDRVETQPPLDVLGAGLIATALLALTWGLTVASDQKGVSVGTACVLGAGGLLLVGFLYVEKICDEGAMMPLSLFGSANFIGLTLMTLLLYGAFMGARSGHRGPRRHTRERERLVSERGAHRNRIQGLLAVQGVTAIKVRARDWPDRLTVACTGDGRTLGVALLAEIRRETERLALIEHQVREVEAAQHAALKADTALAATTCKLRRLKGFGEVLATSANLRSIVQELRLSYPGSSLLACLTHQTWLVETGRPGDYRPDASGFDG